MREIPLNMIVVKVLSEGALSGYGIMKKIKEETGYWKPSPGTIYPLLESLEKQGLVTSKIDGKKKIYSITAKAKIYLKIAGAKKAAISNHTVCCLRMYKFLFGNDAAAHFANEAGESGIAVDLGDLKRVFPELSGIMAAASRAAKNNDKDRIERIKSILGRANTEIKN